MKADRIFALWGSAGHAKVLAESIQRCGGRVVVLFDREAVEPALADVPVYVGTAGFRYWVKQQLNIESIFGLAAIGGGGGRDRLKIQQMFLDEGMQIPVLVDPRSVVSASATLGAGTQVLPGAVVAAHVQVGAACIINHRASLDHECIVGDGTHLAPGATVCGCVRIGQNVFIGAGATILPRLLIRDNAVIGAGAVVTKDVPEGAVVLGCPARPIDQRGELHV